MQTEIQKWNEIMNVLNKHDFPTMEHGRQLLKDKDGYIERRAQKRKLDGIQNRTKLTIIT